MRTERHIKILNARSLQLWLNWLSFFFLLFWAISIKVIYFMSFFCVIFINLPFIVCTILDRWFDFDDTRRWYVLNARVASILCQIIWFYTVKIMWQSHVFKCLKASQSLFPQSSKARFCNFLISKSLFVNSATLGMGTLCFLFPNGVNILCYGSVRCCGSHKL